MRTMIRYAMRSLARRPVVALVLCCGLGIALGLPIAIEMAARRAEQALRHRAASVPLVLGAEGSANDLVFHALEFASDPPGRISVGDWRAFEETGRAETAPLLIEATTRGVPVVGANRAYFRMRGLTLSAGGPIDGLGDAVVGAEVAEQLKVRPGEQLTTDVGELFALSGRLPVRLNVVGRLAPTGTADDMAVFVSLETAWLIAGLGHFHESSSSSHSHNSEGADPTSNTRAGGMIEVTEGNAGGFHFHGSRETFPLTAVLARARSGEDRLWLVGEYLSRSDGVQLAEADRIIDELLIRALRVKRILDLVVTVSVISTVGLCAALVWLTVRLRWDEFRTMARLGLSRARIALIAGVELGMLLSGAACLALGLAILLSWWGPTLFAWVVY